MIAGRAISTVSVMATSQGQVTARNSSGETLVTKVTMWPMNHGTAVSSSATNNSMTNSAASNPFTWRAKCQ
jgi:hypothetical protein